jgi:hypothetical protein
MLTINLHLPQDQLQILHVAEESEKKLLANLVGLCIERGAP